MTAELDYVLHPELLRGNVRIMLAETAIREAELVLADVSIGDAPLLLAQTLAKVGDHFNDVLACAPREEPSL